MFQVPEEEVLKEQRLTITMDSHCGLSLATSCPKSSGRYHSCLTHRTQTSELKSPLHDQIICLEVYYKSHHQACWWSGNMFQNSRYAIRISAGLPAIPTDFSGGFPQYLPPGECQIIPSDGSRASPFKFNSTRYSRTSHLIHRLNSTVETILLSN